LPLTSVSEREENKEEEWAGSELNQRPPPCQGSSSSSSIMKNELVANNNHEFSSGVGHVFESRPTHLQGGQESESPSAHHHRIDWQQFHQFLLQRMTPKTAEDRIRYAKQFAMVLQSNNVGLLQQLPPNKRIHIMKAISSLARYTGQQDTWCQIRQQYGLQWSTGTEKLDAFTRFFDDSKDLHTMIGWLKEALKVMPSNYSNFFLFCTLTGMRASECVETVNLIHNPTAVGSYYNLEQKILQHYRFPHLFIRRTKAVYISVADESIVAIARKIEKPPTLNGLKMQSKHRNLSMRLKYCRKIFASHLHRSGLSSDLIDMLQGRIGKNIFLKHYLTPTADYKDRVLTALRGLQEQLLLKPS
jgi:hypothetical protein